MSKQVRDIGSDSENRRIYKRKRLLHDSSSPDESLERFENDGNWWKSLGNSGKLSENSSRNSASFSSNRRSSTGLQSSTYQVTSGSGFSCSDSNPESLPGTIRIPYRQRRKAKMSANDFNAALPWNSTALPDKSSFCANISVDIDSIGDEDDRENSSDMKRLEYARMKRNARQRNRNQPNVYEGVLNDVTVNESQFKVERTPVALDPCSYKLSDADKSSFVADISDSVSCEEENEAHLIDMQRLKYSRLNRKAKKTERNPENIYATAFKDVSLNGSHAQDNSSSEAYGNGTVNRQLKEVSHLMSNEVRYGPPSSLTYCRQTVTQGGKVGGTTYVTISEIRDKVIFREPRSYARDRSKLSTRNVLPQQLAEFSVENSVNVEYPNSAIEEVHSHSVISTGLIETEWNEVNGVHLYKENKGNIDAEKYQNKDIEDVAYKSSFVADISGSISYEEENENHLFDMQSLKYSRLSRNRKMIKENQEIDYETAFEDVSPNDENSLSEDNDNYEDVLNRSGPRLCENIIEEVEACPTKSHRKKRPRERLAICENVFEEVLNADPKDISNSEHLHKIDLNMCQNGNRTFAFDKSHKIANSKSKKCLNKIDAEDNVEYIVEMVDDEVENDMSEIKNYKHSLSGTEKGDLITIEDLEQNRRTCLVSEINAVENAGTSNVIGKVKLVSIPTNEMDAVLLDGVSVNHRNSPLPNSEVSAIVEVEPFQKIAPQDPKGNDGTLSDNNSLRNVSKIKEANKTIQEYKTTQPSGIINGSSISRESETSLLEAVDEIHFKKKRGVQKRTKSPKESAFAGVLDSESESDSSRARISFRTNQKEVSTHTEEMQPSQLNPKGNDKPVTPEILPKMKEASSRIEESKIITRASSILNSSSISIQEEMGILDVVDANYLKKKRGGQKRAFALQQSAFAGALDSESDSDLSRARSSCKINQKEISSPIQEMETSQQIVPQDLKINESSNKIEESKSTTQPAGKLNNSSFSMQSETRIMEGDDGINFKKRRGERKRTFAMHQSAFAGALDSESESDSSRARISFKTNQKEVSTHTEEMQPSQLISQVNTKGNGRPLSPKENDGHLTPKIVPEMKEGNNRIISKINQTENCTPIQEIQTSQQMVPQVPKGNDANLAVSSSFKNISKINEGSNEIEESKSTPQPAGKLNNSSFSMQSETRIMEGDDGINLKKRRGDRKRTFAMHQSAFAGALDSESDSDLSRAGSFCQINPQQDSSQIQEFQPFHQIVPTDPKINNGTLTESNTLKNISKSTKIEECRATTQPSCFLNSQSNLMKSEASLLDVVDGNFYKEKVVGRKRAFAVHQSAFAGALDSELDSDLSQAESSSNISHKKDLSQILGMQPSQRIISQENDRSLTDAYSPNSVSKMKEANNKIESNTAPQSSGDAAVSFSDNEVSKIANNNLAEKTSIPEPNQNLSKSENMKSLSSEKIKDGSHLSINEIIQKNNSIGTPDKINVDNNILPTDQLKDIENCVLSTSSCKPSQERGSWEELSLLGQNSLLEASKLGFGESTRGFIGPRENARPSLIFRQFGDVSSIAASSFDGNDSRANKSSDSVADLLVERMIDTPIREISNHGARKSGAHVVSIINKMIVTPKRELYNQQQNTENKPCPLESPVPVSDSVIHNFSKSHIAADNDLNPKDNGVMVNMNSSAANNDLNLEGNGVVVTMNPSASDKDLNSKENGIVENMHPSAAGKDYLENVEKVNKMSQPNKSREYKSSVDNLIENEPDISHPKENGIVENMHPSAAGKGDLENVEKVNKMSQPNKSREYKSSVDNLIENEPDISHPKENGIVENMHPSAAGKGDLENVEKVNKMSQPNKSREYKSSVDNLIENEPDISHPKENGIVENMHPSAAGKGDLENVEKVNKMSQPNNSRECKSSVDNLIENEPDISHPKENGIVENMHPSAAGKDELENVEKVNKMSQPNNSREYKSSVDNLIENEPDISHPKENGIVENMHPSAAGKDELENVEKVNKMSQPNKSSVDNLIENEPDISHPKENGIVENMHPSAADKDELENVEKVNKMSQPNKLMEYKSSVDNLIENEPDISHPKTDLLKEIPAGKLAPSASAVRKPFQKPRIPVLIRNKPPRIQPSTSKKICLESSNSSSLKQSTWIKSNELHASKVLESVDLNKSAELLRHSSPLKSLSKSESNLFILDSSFEKLTKEAVTMNVDTSNPLILPAVNELPFMKSRDFEMHITPLPDTGSINKTPIIIDDLTFVKSTVPDMLSIPQPSFEEKINESLNLEVKCSSTPAPLIALDTISSRLSSGNKSPEPESSSKRFNEVTFTILPVSAQCNSLQPVSPINKRSSPPPKTSIKVNELTFVKTDVQLAPDTPTDSEEPKSNVIDSNEPLSAVLPISLDPESSLSESNLSNAPKEDTLPSRDAKESIESTLVQISRISQDIKENLVNDMTSPESLALNNPNVSEQVTKDVTDSITNLKFSEGKENIIALQQSSSEKTNVNTLKKDFTPKQLKDPTINGTFIVSKSVAQEISTSNSATNLQTFENIDSELLQLSPLNLEILDKSFTTATTQISKLPLAEDSVDSDLKNCSGMKGLNINSERFSDANSVRLSRETESEDERKIYQRKRLLHDSSSPDECLVPFENDGNGLKSMGNCGKHSENSSRNSESFSSGRILSKMESDIRSVRSVSSMDSELLSRRLSSATESELHSRRLSGVVELDLQLRRALSAAKYELPSKRLLEETDEELHSRRISYASGAELHSRRISHAAGAELHSRRVSHAAEAELHSGRVFHASKSEIDSTSPSNLADSSLRPFSTDESGDNQETVSSSYTRDSKDSNVSASCTDMSEDDVLRKAVDDWLMELKEKALKAEEEKKAAVQKVFSALTAGSKNALKDMNQRKQNLCKIKRDKKMYDENDPNEVKLKKRRLPVWVKRSGLYDLVENVFVEEGRDAAEEFLFEFVDIVKKVIKSKRGCEVKEGVQKIQKKLFEMNIVTTLNDFYNFVRDYMPFAFRDRSIPCTGRNEEIHPVCVDSSMLHKPLFDTIR